ncbi:MAG: ribosomal-processing cysteine protease Prp [Spirochaetaceae bacterium]|nr:ribosomal-processing cysteine protease Prp [Spirochaetaceae bacterium]
MDPLILKIDLCLNSNNIIKYVTAEGHAGKSPAGENIICAAVSVLLRSAYRTIVKNSKVEACINAKSEGSLYFRVIQYEESQAEWLKGISDYLLTGIKDIKTESPDSIKIIITVEI